MAVILVVDNYDSFTYNLVQYVGQMTDVVVLRNDAATVDEVLALAPDGVVISPGPGRPENAGMIVPLIQRAAAHIPILGVCLGHQAIALAFGGSVIPATVLMHGKADDIYHQGSGLLQDLPNPFSAGRYHSLAVDVGNAPSLRVDAESRDGTVMAVSHRSLPVFGIQFHPESVLTPEGMRIVEHFVGATAAPGAVTGGMPR